MAATPGTCPLPAGLLDHPRYRIVEYLGSGGMGTVYKAQHRVMDRPVALKIISPNLVNRPAMVDRFHCEVKAAARLHHPNIVAAYDADQAGGTHFLVMEFIAGVDLDYVVKERGALPMAAACDYARQAALGLQHALEKGMVHRDIKPHNLMLTSAGTVKVLDFGLARFISEVAPAAVTASTPAASAEAPAAGANDDLEAAPRLFKGTAYVYTGAGTADYMAPEEALDARRADIRADIYSLGCTLYCFLAGRVPFPEGSLLDKLRFHLERVPDPLRELRPDLPARLIQVVERMMAKDPANRFQTPAAVAAALAPFLGPCGSWILVVDDEPGTRAALAESLEDEGYAVAQAADGQEALSRLRQPPLPSLILLDLMMPVMDGWEFLREMKADPALAWIPVIVISAIDQKQAKAAALGAADYLRKPFGLGELAGKVREFTGRP